MKRYRLSVSKFPLGKQQVACQIETEKECSRHFTLLLPAASGCCQIPTNVWSVRDETPQPQQEEGPRVSMLSGPRFSFSFRICLLSFEPPGCICPVWRETLPIQEGTGFPHFCVFSCHSGSYNALFT